MDSPLKMIGIERYKQKTIQYGDEDSEDTMSQATAYVRQDAQDEFQSHGFRSHEFAAPHAPPASVPIQNADQVTDRIQGISPSFLPFSSSKSIH